MNAYPIKIDREKEKNTCTTSEVRKGEKKKKTKLAMTTVYVLFDVLSQG